MFSSYAGLGEIKQITPVDRIKHQQIDLTGTIASFFKKETFGYYRKGQVLTLSYPAFAFKPDPTATTSEQFGLIVSYVSGINRDGETGQLKYLSSEPTDNNTSGWWFTDQDDSAMSTAHLYWNNPSVAFNGVLVRQIKISLPDTVAQAEVTVQYQSFINDRTALVSKMNEDKTLISKSNEDETSKLNEDNTEGPVNTKEAVAVLQREVKFLEERLNSVYRNYVSASNSTPELLEADPTGRREDNYVRNELHYMDVDKKIIIPSNGAFYPGTASEGNLLKVVVPTVEFGAVTNDDIATGSKIGWLFCYMVNNLFVYEPTHDPGPVNGESYYLITPYGTYEKIQVEEGDTWEKIKKRYKEDADKAGKYLTDEIFVRSNSKYNPELNFDGTINHTASRVSREEQVLLTDKNISRYLNYSGKFIDVNAQSPDSTVLTLGEHYVVAGLDAAKTAATLRQEPVYTKIRLLDNTAVDSLYVSISYQAYGGMVTVESIQQIQKEVKNLSQLMMDQKFLTVNQFDTHPSIDRLNRAVTALNDYIGNFYQAVYRVPFKIPSNESFTKMQWVNIALLKDPAWLTKLNGRSECGQFRVSSKVQGWSHDFTVAIDLDKILSSKNGQHAYHGVFKVISNTIPKYREDEDIIVNPDADERIALRLCWNGDGTESGLMLQLGWDFSAYSEEDYQDNEGIDEITVVNKSGGITNWTVISAEDSGVDGEMDRVRVYNRIQYERVPTGNSLVPGTVYFVPDTAYNYFATQDKTVQNKKYYTRKTTSGSGGLGYKYEEVATGLVVGRPFPNTSITYYERIKRQKIYRAYTVTKETVVKDSTNVYLPVYVSASAGESSYDTASFFFDNYIGNQTATAVKWTANDNGGESHYAISLLETTKEGILAWSGSIPLSRWSSAPGVYRKPIKLYSFITQQMKDCFVKENVEEAVLVIYDAMQGVDRKIRVPLACSSKDIALYGEAFFCPQDLCTVEFVMPNPGEITLYTELGIASQTQERFDLRSIWIRFK